MNRTNADTRTLLSRTQPGVLAVDDLSRAALRSLQSAVDRGLSVVLAPPRRPHDKSQMERR